MWRVKTESKYAEAATRHHATIPMLTRLHRRTLNQTRQLQGPSIRVSETSTPCKHQNYVRERARRTKRTKTGGQWGARQASDPLPHSNAPQNHRPEPTKTSPHTGQAQDEEVPSSLGGYGPPCRGREAAAPGALRGRTPQQHHPSGTCGRQHTTPQKCDDRDRQEVRRTKHAQSTTPKTANQNCTPQSLGRKYL